jgi:hypothetical protein
VGKILALNQYIVNSKKFSALGRRALKIWMKLKLYTHQAISCLASVSHVYKRESIDCSGNVWPRLLPYNKHPSSGAHCLLTLTLFWLPAPWPMNYPLLRPNICSHFNHQGQTSSLHSVSSLNVIRFHKRFLTLIPDSRKAVVILHSWPVLLTSQTQLGA